MKKLSLIFILLFTISIAFSQEITKTEKKTFDTKLVGCWKGTEADQQQKGLNKYWVSCRFENGKSTLLFIIIDENGKVTQITENGSWWVENGKYYELHNFDEKTDIYDYEIAEGSIKFKSVELMGKKDTSYSFTDYRIEDK